MSINMLSITSLLSASCIVAPAGRPAVSIHCPFASAPFKKRWLGWGYVDPWTPMRNATACEMRRFYWAATSFVDAMVGLLLDEVEAADLSRTTLVVFHSDHGWSLGEGGDWKKFSLTELGLRVPLIIKVPWMPHTAGKRCDALVELVDVMPTMSDLVGLPPPTIHPGDAALDGASLAPLFSLHPPALVKPSVWAQYPRCPVNTSDPSRLWYDNLCINTPASKFGWMGYSLRTPRWRYTAWFRWNGSSLQPIMPAGSDVPANNTDGFYNELYTYTAREWNGSDLQLLDFDTIDVDDVGRTNPSIIQQLHMMLRSLIGH
eukprot:m.1466877 g.1466877  ORF g.1466877 m.1466877 type:complete len:317 (+) comp25138_c0_seq20:1658-2608(+)